MTNHAAGKQLDSGGEGQKAHSKRFRAAACSSLVLLCCSLFPASAKADDLKVNGQWIPNLTVQNVRGGQISYITTSGNELEQPLTNVDGIKLTALPDLGASEAALDAKKYDEALAGQQKALANAKQPWLKQWIQSRMLKSQDALGKGVEATENYLQLVRDKAPAALLASPPVKAIAASTPAQKADILARLSAASAGAGDDVKPSLQKMIDAAKAGSAAPAAPKTPAAPAAPATPAAPGAAPAAPAAPVLAPAADGEEASAVLLPVAMEAKDPIAQLLRKGQFQQAIDEANKILDRPNLEMALRLYQKGVAQMNLGAAKNDLNLYRDAGLSFMRVNVYFPKSVYAGPALVEAGVVHVKIGRPDIAAKLWTKSKLLIDGDTDPAYEARLNTLMAAEESGAEASK